MKILKTFFIIAFALVMTVLSTGCAEIGEFSVNEKIVCEVDGEPITYDDYKYFFYRHYVSTYGDDFSELSEEKFNKIKGLTEESLRKRAFIFSLIEEYDLELTDDDEEMLDYYVEQQIEENGGEEKYKEYLLENRLTGKVFREQIELTFFWDPMLRDLLSTGIDKRVDMSDAAVIADVNGGNFYRYAQIYYSVAPGELDTAAREKINKAYEMLEAGNSFEYAANASWATSITEQNKFKSEWKVDVTKGAYVAKGEKEALLEDTVLSLEEGAYSAPKWSGSGWHIFIRLPFDTTYAENNLHTVTTGENTLAEQSFARRYLEHIEQGSKDIEIEYAKYFEESITFSMLMKKDALED
jgi:hypothetical protein